MPEHEYTPDEETMTVAWIEYEASDDDINEADAEAQRLIEKVKRDAAREALDGLAADELARVASLGKHSYPAQIAQGIAQAAWNYKWKHYGGAHHETEDQT